MKTKSTKQDLPPEDNVSAVADAAAEELYLAGFTFYRQGNYAEATHFFRVMSSLFPRDPRGWMGLGASLQMGQLFEEAIEAYMLADAADPSGDPRAPLHAAECYWSMKRQKEANKALAAARRRAEGRQEQKVLQKIGVFEMMWSSDAS